MTYILANPLQPLINVAEAILRFFHDEAGFSWGAAIIGMTFVVRLAIVPLTYKGIVGMRDMQRLAPEMKKIQEKHKDDKQAQNEAIMRFYQEHKVNPFSSCLPLLLQIPFFMALFYLLRGDEFRQDIRGEESFLFIDDLAKSATDDLPVLFALLALYVGTQLGASLVTAMSADPKQRKIMLALPFLFVPFVFSFPTGLLVYWITTNVWTIGQQLFVKKFIPAPDLSGLTTTDDEDGKKKAKLPSPATAAAATDVEGGGRSRFGIFDAARKAAEARVGNGGGDAAGGGGTATKPAPAKAGGNGAKSGNGAGKGNGAKATGQKPAAPPPKSPRKKKKRSGRRR